MKTKVGSLSRTTKLTNLYLGRFRKNERTYKLFKIRNENAMLLLTIQK